MEISLSCGGLSLPLIMSVEEGWPYLASCKRSGVSSVRERLLIRDMALDQWFMVTGFEIITVVAFFVLTL